MDVGEFAEEFLREFLAECRENLAAADRILAHLEPGPAPATTLDALHRVFHSIKGSSACFEHDALAKLGAEAEEIAEVLQRDQSVSADARAQLMRLTDEVRRKVDAIVPTTDAAPVIAAFDPTQKLGRRVMVVDDSGSVRALVERMLSPEFHCTGFGDGVEALNAALRERPDVIVSDVVMPNMNGYELCQRIRSEPSLSDVPFILLTSQQDPDGRAEGLEQGADDYLGKPIRPRELLARVRSLLRLHDAQAQIRRQKDAIASSHEQLLETQRQLVQSEKLAAIGAIAAGVSHEVNNPLGFIMSGVSQLIGLVRELAEAKSSSTTQKADALRDAEEIETEVNDGRDRIQSIVQSLRLLGAPKEEPVWFNVEAEIERAISILQGKLTGVALTKDYGVGKQVCLTQGCVTQITLNLLANCVDGCAKRSGSVIVVRTRHEATGVEISVEDNGAGISAENLPRVFEPFFTTKPAGKGTGLGLSVCLNLAKRMGGTIQLNSRPGQSTVARIWLPTRSQDAGAAFHAARADGVAAR